MNDLDLLRLNDKGKITLHCVHSSLRGGHHSVGSLARDFLRAVSRNCGLFYVGLFGENKVIVQFAPIYFNFRLLCDPTRASIGRLR